MADNVDNELFNIILAYSLDNRKMAYNVVGTTGSTTYFHHTTKECAMAIMHEGVILQSTGVGGDAVYGIGTYLTLLGPECSAEEIALNNWDHMKGSGRTDAMIAIEMPAQEACKVIKLPGNRDIHLYPGDLKLSNKNLHLYVRDENGKAREYTFYKQ